MAQLTAALYGRHIDWLSDFAALLRAENKILQLQVAQELSVPIPDTLITSDYEALRRWQHQDVVVKPLAASSFQRLSGQVLHVPCSARRIDELRCEDVAEAPFVYQQVIHAKAHFRVVTVAKSAWVARLDGAKIDGIDWRLDNLAHESFEDLTAEERSLAGMALGLALNFGLGFSSQDWIRDASGATYFLDLNPSGQWMFLPHSITSAIAHAIADFLLGGDWVAA